MSLFKQFNKAPRPGTMRFIPYGTLKKDGSHDHRTNKGHDRTQAQKAGDRNRRKGG
jgi:hypothetical protein